MYDISLNLLQKHRRRPRWRHMVGSVRQPFPNLLHGSEADALNNKLELVRAKQSYPSVIVTVCSPSSMVAERRINLFDLVTSATLTRKGKARQNKGG